MDNEASALVSSALDALIEPHRAGVLGVGVDVENVDRWRSANLRLDTLFTEQELEYLSSRADPAVHSAGFWCAKEAIFKAVSQHLTVSLRDIVLSHRPDGSLVVALKGYGDDTASRVRVSVSHTPTLAAAVALFV